MPRRFELFHIARAGTEKTVDGPQYAKCRLPINLSEVRTGFRRPENGLFQHVNGLAVRKAELAEDVLVGNALATVERGPRLVECRGFLGGNGFLLH